MDFYYIQQLKIKANIHLEFCFHSSKGCKSNIHSLLAPLLAPWGSLAVQFPCSLDISWVCQLSMALCPLFYTIFSTSRRLVLKMMITWQNQNSKVLCWTIKAKHQKLLKKKERKKSLVELRGTVDPLFTTFKPGNWVTKFNLLTKIEMEASAPFPTIVPMYHEANISRLRALPTLPAIWSHGMEFVLIHQPAQMQEANI